MTRTTIKNRINAILREKTSGFHKDDYWAPIYAAFNAITSSGFELEVTGSKYDHDDNGQPVSKCWTFQIIFGTKPIYGVMTAHGAGTVEAPLSRYDVSAYVS